MCKKYVKPQSLQIANFVVKKALLLLNSLLLSEYPLVTILACSVASLVAFLFYCAFTVCLRVPSKKFQACLKFTIAAFLLAVAGIAHRWVNGIQLWLADDDAGESSNQYKWTVKISVTDPSSLTKFIIKVKQCSREPDK